MPIIERDVKLRSTGRDLSSSPRVEGGKWMADAPETVKGHIMIITMGGAIPHGVVSSAQDILPGMRPILVSAGKREKNDPLVGFIYSALLCDATMDYYSKRKRPLHLPKNVFSSVLAKTVRPVSSRITSVSAASTNAAPLGGTRLSYFESGGDLPYLPGVTDPNSQKLSPSLSAMAASVYPVLNTLLSAFNMSMDAALTQAWMAAEQTLLPHPVRTRTPSRFAVGLARQGGALICTTVRPLLSLTGVTSGIEERLRKGSQVQSTYFGQTLVSADVGSAIEMVIDDSFSAQPVSQPEEAPVYYEDEGEVSI